MNVISGQTSIAQTRKAPANPGKSEPTSIADDIKQGVQDFFKPSETDEQMSMRALLGGLGGAAAGLVGVAAMADSGAAASLLAGVVLGSAGGAAGWYAADQIAANKG